MYSLSLSVATPFPLLCIFEYTTIRVSSDHNSHTFCYFDFVFLKRYLYIVVCGLLHPLFLQCLLSHLCSIRTCPNGTWQKFSIWETCSPMPHHSPRSGVAQIGQIKSLALILEDLMQTENQMEELEKLSVAPQANFTIQQKWTVTCVPLDNTTI